MKHFLHNEHHKYHWKVAAENFAINILVSLFRQDYTKKKLS